VETKTHKTRKAGEDGNSQGEDLAQKDTADARAKAHMGQIAKCIEIAKCFNLLQIWGARTGTKRGDSR
jgi:hypothetical protein